MFINVTVPTIRLCFSNSAFLNMDATIFPPKSTISKTCLFLISKRFVKTKLLISGLQGKEIRLLFPIPLPCFQHVTGIKRMLILKPVS